MTTRGHTTGGSPRMVHLCRRPVGPYRMASSAFGVLQRCGDVCMQRCRRPACCIGPVMASGVTIGTQRHASMVERCRRPCTGGMTG
jgi:hypothetical protein